MGRIGVFGRVLAAACLFAANAYAQDSERRYDFHIETRTLGRALEAFVELTGAPLIYPQELADEGGVNSVKGKYTVEEALNALLRDSEFSGGLTQGGVIVISLNKTARGAEVSKTKLKRSLFVSAAALFNVSHVMAQDDAGNPVDTMVVTGSRVARTGFDTPTPTTVISSDQIMQTGLVDTGAIVMQNPQISVGLGSTNDTFNRDIGSSFINLRGLGPNRTLVLIDGRRRVSGSREGSQVDLGSIPPGMIESIEIITGGASAVYGADAVSGVVNVKLKKDFEGLEATARAGISQHGDAETRAALLQLVENAKVTERRDAMFAGAPINETEGRAVLHTALRNLDGGPVEVAGEDVMPQVRDTLARMRSFADQVRGGDITDVVNIGIGGSDLGPRMAADALAHLAHPGVRVHYVSNPDAWALWSVLRGLDAPETPTARVSFPAQCCTDLNGRAQPLARSRG